MSRIKIEDTEFADFDVRYRVCCHLQPILNFLELEGYNWPKGEELELGKAEPATLVVDKELNFDAIKQAFELPEYIKLIEEDTKKIIFCDKCWSAISDRKRRRL